MIIIIIIIVVIIVIIQATATKQSKDHNHNFSTQPPIRIVEVQALSHQGYPLTYELTSDTGRQSNEFAINPVTGVVDLLKTLDYERDPHQYHLKVKVVENGRVLKSSFVNVSGRFFFGEGGGEGLGRWVGGWMGG